MTEQTAEQNGNAQEMTPAAAAAHIARVKAGAVSATPPPQPEPQPIDEGFVVVNPPVAVYQPTKVGDALRGVVLGRFTDDALERDFFLLDSGGEMTAVYEAPTLKPLETMVPSWAANDDGVPRMLVAHEVIIDPIRKAGPLAWDFIIQTRVAPNPAALRTPPAPPVPVPTVSKGKKK